MRVRHCRFGKLLVPYWIQLRHKLYHLSRWISFSSFFHFFFTFSPPPPVLSRSLLLPYFFLLIRRYYGANCTACQCVSGTCDSGITGTGQCTCNAGYVGSKCNTPFSPCSTVVSYIHYPFSLFSSLIYHSHRVSCVKPHLELW